MVKVSKHIILINLVCQKYSNKSGEQATFQQIISREAILDKSFSTMDKGASSYQINGIGCSHIVSWLL